MKYKNLQKNSGPALYGVKNSRSGFVILFVVTLSSILLSIALGVANIALKEVKFGTSARDANDAFFAADTGIECALFYDYAKGSNNSFGGTGPNPIQCLGGDITINGASPTWDFKVLGLGSSGQGCAKVTVNKTVTPPLTTIISKGYNDGGPSCTQGSNSVERELEVTN